MAYYGGIEAGGTKFVCIVGRGPDDIRAEVRFPTTDPAETLGRAVAFFQAQQAEVQLAALGVGSFGPVDLAPASPTFGTITNTIKPGWPQTDLVGMLRASLRLPVAIDTDVGVAAYGEYCWGASQGLDPSLYLTIGTGIGGAMIYGGKPFHGLLHPEIGHMRVPHDRALDPFPGMCLFHGDCLEGLACGPAMQERWGQPAETLPDDHPAWELEAHYLGLGLATLIVITSPRRIVLGGGVMERAALFERVRAKTQQFLNGYLQAPPLIDDIEQYIVPPALGNRAGALGAIALAMDTL